MMLGGKEMVGDRAEIRQEGMGIDFYQFVCMQAWKMSNKNEISKKKKSLTM